MARLIEPSKAEQVIVPANEYEFGAHELADYLGGPFSEIREILLAPYGTCGALYVIINGDFVRSNLPVNEAATKILHHYRPEMADIVLRGNVMITNRHSEQCGQNPHVLFLSSRVPGRVALDSPDGHTLSTDHPIALLEGNDWIHGYVIAEGDDSYFVPNGGSRARDKILLSPGRLVLDEPVFVHGG